MCLVQPAAVPTSSRPCYSIDVCTATVLFLTVLAIPIPLAPVQTAPGRLFGDVLPVRLAALPKWHGLRGAAEKHE
jgi:hypothetical protein